MPIYEYTCRACGHEFEVIQKITDRPIRKCEKCGKLQAKRRISQTSFLLKGSGWYTTDYAGHKAHGGSESETSKPAASEPAASEPAASEPATAPASAETKKTKKPPEKAANA